MKLYKLPKSGNVSTNQSVNYRQKGDRLFQVGVKSDRKKLPNEKRDREETFHHPSLEEAPVPVGRLYNRLDRTKTPRSALKRIMKDISTSFQKRTQVINPRNK